MSGKKDHNSGFDQIVVPKRGRYAGCEIKVSKYQKERLLKLDKVVLPGSIQAKKLKDEAEKKAKEEA
ncbi:hypothetical protein KA005_47120, partial [bacterium]|nr:hypothetical protein [bacterium]